MNGTATTSPFVDSADIAMLPARRSPGSGLPGRLSLKPYGDELLTRSGDFWIFCARLIILAMALAEGLAWGYMGSLMSREYPLIAGAIAGAFVFTLIWVIDASFMTLDLARRRYDQALLGRDEGSRAEKWKLAAGVIARICIVTASLIITAPFLAQAIFSADVKDEMSRRNSLLIAEQRAEVEAPYLARLAQLRTEQAALEQQRVLEAAGSGPSGRYGRGPALETIELQLVDTRAEIAAVETARGAALTRFDGLSTEQLEEQYGLRFMTGGIQASSQLLGEMLRNPQFTNAERAVRAFLAFLFLGLLILKGFQPRSIAVYYSERMHSAYDEYRKGVFDPWLPQAERASAGGQIDPLRFEDWCLTSYRAIRHEDERRMRSAREMQAHELRMEQWKNLESHALLELQPLIRQHELAVNNANEIETLIGRGRAARSATTAELESIRRVRSSMQDHVARGGMDGPTFEQAMKASRETDEKIRTLESKVSDLDSEIGNLERRLAGARSDIAVLDQQIATKQRVVDEMQQKISAERIRLAAVTADDSGPATA